MTNDGIALLNPFKIDRSTKDSRQAECLKSAIRNLQSEIRDLPLSFSWTITCQLMSLGV